MKRPLFTLTCILAGLFVLLGLGGLAARAQEVLENASGVYAPLVMGGVQIKGASTCFNSFLNSSFETADGWEIPLTAYPAGYSTAQARTGARSMRTGVTAAADNRYSYSDARQVVTIPAGATSVTLRMWTYPLTSEAPAAFGDVPIGLAAEETGLPEIFEGQPFGVEPMAGDVQYVLVLNQYGTWIDTLLWQRSNTAQWTEKTFNLSAYRGQTIKIQFGTYNDGFGGFTSMFVDDAVLEICSTTPTPGPTASPTVLVSPTPTNTPLPSPTSAPNCFEAVANGGFESFSAWEVPVTEYSAGYSQARVHSGAYSLRTGITYAPDNRYSYSSFHQRVTIPATATSAQLRFWAYRQTSQVLTQGDEAEQVPPTREGELFAEQFMAGDVQYALILNSSKVWVGTMIWNLSNAQAWTQYGFDLMDYRGQTIYIHFGTYNDGADGISAMYIDDVSLSICASPTLTPTATPTATLTPTAPPPGTCTNLLGNSGFESNLSWQIPVTEYTAGYSTARAFAGVRSMRTGITTAADNRYSYSDAYQTVVVPPNISSLTLRLRAFQQSSETTIMALPETMEGQVFGEAALAGDVQYVLILDRYGTWIDTVLWQRRNTGAWTEIVSNLTNYKGWTIRLQFGTYNDGLGGITSMYVDEMTLQACP
jgi:hypothetical protein